MSCFFFMRVREPARQERGKLERNRGRAGVKHGRGRRLSEIVEGNEG